MLNVIPKDKDGDSSDETIDAIHIDVVDNGWLVTFLEAEESVKQEVYAYKDGKKMFERLSRELGVVDERIKPTK